MRGFTLIEALVVVALAAVLAAMAAPSFGAFANRRATTAAAQAMVTDLRFARIEAVKRLSNVVMCRSSDGIGCGPATVNWGQGWLVFVDADGDGTYDTDETVLRVQQPPTGVASISGASVATDPQRFVFRSTGFATAAAASFFVDPTGVVTTGVGSKRSSSRLVCVSATGRPSLRDFGATEC
jgi:type IV fimbrial biogenesis protein FimT